MNQVILHRILFLAATLFCKSANGLLLSPCKRTNQKLECIGVKSIPVGVHKNVTILKLSDCDLDAIGSNTLASLGQLKRFDLHSCRVKVIKSCAFSDLNLTRIVLKNSSIDTVEPYAFSNLTGITFSFEDTAFRKIAPLSFSDIHNVTDMDLLGVNIESLQTKAFHNITGQRTLINGSFIKFLYPNVLSSFKFRSTSVVKNHITHTCNLKTSLKNSPRSNFFQNIVQHTNCSPDFYQMDTNWTTASACVKLFPWQLVSVSMATLHSTISTSEITGKDEIVTTRTGLELSTSSLLTDTSYNDTELQLNSTQEQRLNSTLEEQLNSTQEKPLNSTQEKLLNSTQEQQLNSTLEQQLNSTQEKPLNSTQEQRLNSTQQQWLNSTQLQPLNSTQEQHSTTVTLVNSTMETMPHSVPEKVQNSTRDSFMNLTMLTNNTTKEVTENPTAPITPTTQAKWPIEPHNLVPCLKIVTTRPELQPTNGNQPSACPKLKGATLTLGLLCAFYRHFTALL